MPKNIDWKALASPFDRSDVSYRIQSVNKNKTEGLVLPYVTSRAVQSRLDDVVGPENWADSYEEWQPARVALDPMAAQQAGWNSYGSKTDEKSVASFVESYYQKSVKCKLAIRVNGEWLVKEGIAQNTDIEGSKGGESGALRRAAVKFGIARYLYSMTELWIPLSLSRNPGMESSYFKGSYYYYAKPDLEAIMGQRSRTGNPSVGVPSAKEALRNAGQPAQTQQGTPAQGATTQQTAQQAPNPAVPTAEIMDWQSRLAPLASNNATASKFIPESSEATDSMTKVSKLLGCCYYLFPEGSGEQNAIAEIKASGILPDMVITLKNSIRTLEERAK